MLKSRAPSRLKKGALTLPSSKRQKTAALFPLSRSRILISAETSTTGTGPSPPSEDDPTVVNNWSTRTTPKVSPDGQEMGSKPRQQRASRASFQNKRFENKTNNASSSPTAEPSRVVHPGNPGIAAKEVEMGKDGGSVAPVNRSSPAETKVVASSLVTRVKAREERRTATRAASAAVTEAPRNGNMNGRAPSSATMTPTRDRAGTSSTIASTGRSSSRIRSRKLPGSTTSKQSSQKSQNMNSSSGAQKNADDSWTTKTRSSVNTSSTDGSLMPSKKRDSPTVAVKNKNEEKIVARKTEEEEEEEELPPCPYPGHKNVSWTCLACGGARHHLTSRSAMEPLQRVHGFKVHRVPNDGDCFFSSIKAALTEGAAIDRGRSLEGVGAEAREGEEETAPTAGKGLTVAEMREWVAEETGQEQLEFYILQAGANPMDRWLDFVRPLDERMPSDNEEEEEDDEDDEDSYKDNSASTPSSQSRSQISRGQSGTSSRKSSSRRRPPSRTARTRNGTKSDSRPDSGSGDGNGVEKAGKGGNGDRGERMEGVAGASPLKCETAASGDRADSEGVGKMVISSASDDRAARRLSRIRKREIALRGLAESKEPAQANAAISEETHDPPPPPSPPSRGAAPAESETRKSARLEQRARTAGPRRAGGGSGEEKLEGGEKSSEDENKEEKGNEMEERGEGEGLPVVQTVEELRRFVRLEGSVVGHSNCMWADTFAHHVVSRKLNITILFVDMERDKNAWPYRVLARTLTESDDEEDERFVVLKREPCHFVLLKTAAPPEEKDGAGASNNSGATSAKRGGREGQACFSRSDLPDVVRRLWQIEPTKTKVSASPGK